MFNIRDVDWQDELRALQAAVSHRGVILSRDLAGAEYDSFLQYASPLELERDIMFEATYRKMLRDTSRSVT